MDTRPRHETAQDSRQEQTTSTHKTTAAAADNDEEDAQMHKMNSHMHEDDNDKDDAMMRTMTLMDAKDVLYEMIKA